MKIGFALGFFVTFLAQSAFAELPSPVLLVGAKVLDVECKRLLDGQAVLVSEGRIAQIGPLATIKLPNGITPARIDLTGSTLLPGLIDLHSHLLLHPYNETEWNDQVLKESLEFRTIRGVTAARKTLEAGFTTLRDLGTEGAGYADVALRDAIEKGLIPGPRLFVVTRAIVATNCYGPAGADPRWSLPKGAQEATGIVEVRKAVREQIAGGADWIKVYADYRRKPGAEATPTFSQEELNALVEEAHSAGLKVAAHAMTDEGIRRAVMAGVATIEHGYEVSDKTLALMKQRNVVLCPTLTAVESVSRYEGWKRDMPDPPRIHQAKEMFRRAMKSGVMIACGSDVGVFPHGENARELELMVEYGMKPAEALRSATLTAAKVLNHDADMGRIKPGYLADLVAVRGNPLVDIKSLRSVELVVSRGRIAWQKHPN